MSRPRQTLLSATRPAGSRRARSTASAGAETTDGTGPDRKGARAVFDREYLEWRNILASRPEAASDEEKLLSRVPGHARLALDAGCGRGSTAFRLAEHVERVAAVDLERRMLALAAREKTRLGKTNVDFVQGDIDRLPFKAPSFDLIVSQYALHYTDLRKSLPALGRLLKPKGMLLVVDKSPRFPRLKRYVAWNLLGVLSRVPRYLRRYGLKTTVRLLRFEAGPTWLRHQASHGRGGLLSRPSLFGLFRLSLPGCRLRYRGGLIRAVWEAPGTGQVRDRSLPP